MIFKNLTYTRTEQGEGNIIGFKYFRVIARTFSHKQTTKKADENGNVKCFDNYDLHIACWEEGTWETRTTQNVETFSYSEDELSEIIDCYDFYEPEDLPLTEALARQGE
tara:strand:+ start:1224 stop:1550 length:327 start_codon:yes stop_codon:yes gene_type:complete